MRQAMRAMNFPNLKVASLVIGAFTAVVCFTVFYLQYTRLVASLNAADVQDNFYIIASYDHPVISGFKSGLFFGLFDFHPLWLIEPIDTFSKVFFAPKVASLLAPHTLIPLLLGVTTSVAINIFIFSGAYALFLHARGDWKKIMVARGKCTS
jgi:hypothetical protein